MAQIDLINSIPEELAEKANLRDLLETVRGIKQWEKRHAEVLDTIYRYRLVRLVRLRGTEENAEEQLKALLDHLDRVTHPSRMNSLEALDKCYGSRWLAYLDILEDRLAASQSPIPSILLTRAHVPQILEMVADDEPVSISEIRRRLNLKSANLTRILDMMEANELIEREAAGKEKLLRLGMNGLKLLTQRERTTSPQAQERGLHYLRQRRAA